MPLSIRSLTTRLSESASNLLSAPRRKSSFPVTVSLEIHTGCGKLNNPPHKLTVSGVTTDFSRDDINFVLPVIRLGEHYLAGGAQKLILEIETPERLLRIKAVARRYESLERRDSANRYLIEAQIGEMSEADAEFFEHLIKHGTGVASENPVFEFQPKTRKTSLISQLFNL